VADELAQAGDETHGGAACPQDTEVGSKETAGAFIGYIRKKTYEAQ